MKIVHLCFMGPFTDGWSYQENILTKHQRINGNDVTIITGCFEHDENGNIVKTSPLDEISSNGCRLIRIQYSNPISGKIPLLRKYHIIKYLFTIQPDFIFCHGIGANTYLELKKYYKKNPDCRIVADSHVYYDLEGYDNSLRTKLGNLFVRLIIKRTDYLFKKYYCITPACIDVAVKKWKISKEKIELLPLGFDDSIIDLSQKEKCRKMLCEKYKVPIDAVIIATGGKINEEKNIHIFSTFLKQYLLQKKNSKLYLFIFGSYADECIAKTIRENIDNVRIFSLGFLNQKEITTLYLSVDAAFFPGGQSVLWQHAIGCELPLFVKKWIGIDYLNVNNNVYILNDVSREDFYSAFNYLDSVEFNTLKANAQSKTRLKFSYNEQAKKVLE